jgi:hypothetical protein
MRSAVPSERREPGLKVWADDGGKGGAPPIHAHATVSAEARETAMRTLWNMAAAIWTAGSVLLVATVAVIERALW